MSDPPTVAAEPYVQFKLCSAVFKASNGVGEGRIRGPPPSFSRRGGESLKGNRVLVPKKQADTQPPKNPLMFLLDSTLCTTRGRGKLRLSRLTTDTISIFFLEVEVKKA